MSERMIDHITFHVADINTALSFYEAALKPLGMQALYRLDNEMTGGVEVVGMGDHKPFFWLAATGKARPVQHIAFRARDRAEVDAFYQAAMAAGGRDNGPPGLRPHYHENYYGAFVLDPEGHNIEAVCHEAN